MTITIDGEEKRLGLALSGGGFRAAAFHLGVFEKLQSLRLLDKIDVLTCVSGGSIAGGHLAANWGSADALDKLENYLRTKSIAVSSFVGGIVNPFSTRLDELAKSYQRDLFNNRNLDTLKHGPRIYFNTTNLSTGNCFFFVAGGGGDSEMGEHELGTFQAGNFEISRAVAASSAFPPVFPPLRVDQDAYPAGGIDYVTLTDGGVYDNLGVNPLFVKRNTLDYAFVSDAGKPFAISDQPTETGSVILAEAINILMEQVRGLQFDRLNMRHRVGMGPKPLWFSIDSEEGQLQSGDAQFASTIGTNLTKLNDAEMAVLMRHSGALLESRIQRYAPELLM